MSEKNISIDKDHVLGVMNFNKVDEVLVTSNGHVYLKKAESFCKSECGRTESSYRVVTREELADVELTLVEELNAMSVADLKAFAEEIAIKVEGKKPQIIAMIKSELENRTKEVEDDLEKLISSTTEGLDTNQNNTPE